MMTFDIESDAENLLELIPMNPRLFYMIADGAVGVHQADDDEHRGYRL